METTHAHTPVRRAISIYLGEGLALAGGTVVLAVIPGGGDLMKSWFWIQAALLGEALACLSLPAAYNTPHFWAVWLSLYGAIGLALHGFVERLLSLRFPYTVGGRALLSWLVATVIFYTAVFAHAAGK